MSRESHKAFAARMDRAREAESREVDSFASVYMVIWAAVLGGVYFARSESRAVVAILLVAMVSTLVVVMLRALAAIYRSRSP